MLGITLTRRLNLIADQTPSNCERVFLPSSVFLDDGCFVLLVARNLEVAPSRA